MTIATKRVKVCCLKAVWRSRAFVGESFKLWLTMTLKFCDCAKFWDLQRALRVAFMAFDRGIFPGFFAIKGWKA